jgi:hypothetical protein
MPIRERTEGDETILTLKAEGLSFREVSKRFGKSIGSVTGRYYRLMGVRHPSQIAKDAKLRRKRKLRRAERTKKKSLAAIQASIELHNNVEFSVAVGRAQAAGASLDMIGACCGVSKQAIHKRCRRYVSTGEVVRSQNF